MRNDQGYSFRNGSFGLKIRSSDAMPAASRMPARIEIGKTDITMFARPVIPNTKKTNANMTWNAMSACIRSGPAAYDARYEM